MNKLVRLFLILCLFVALESCDKEDDELTDIEEIQNLLQKYKDDGYSCSVYLITGEIIRGEHSDDNFWVRKGFLQVDGDDSSKAAYSFYNLKNLIKYEDDHYGHNIVDLYFSAN